MLQENFAFSTEMQELMSFIRTVDCPDKEVFIRELILNASVALNKVKFKSTIGYDVSKEPNLRIRVIPDKINCTLSVMDTGIGMTRDELINKLVTIQKPGTAMFIELLRTKDNISAISPFNLGFYSVFLVANRVTVITKSDSEPIQWKWDSMGYDFFSISDDSKNPEQLVRGTKVTLHLKEEDLDFLEEDTLREIIKRRCDFIDFPIELQIVRRVKEGDDEILKQSEKKLSEEGKIKEEKHHAMIIYEWEKVNKTKPIWLKKPEDITQEEYAAFYRSLTNDREDPLAVKHFSAEGKIEFTAILFIPKKAPSDFHSVLKKRNIRLYVRRVLLTDEFKELLPEYLDFVKGVVDSEDLPLNIPYEMFYESEIIKLIRLNVIKKVLESIHEITKDKDTYNKFYEQFSKNIKLGIQTDPLQKVKLSELLRFYTSKSQGEQISLREYVSRMPTDQRDIYFIIAESRSTAANSSIHEYVKKKGYEVIYMVDSVDESMVQELGEYDGRRLKDCSKDDMEIEREEQPKMIKEADEGFSKRSQGEVGIGLGSKMEEINDV